MSAAALRARVGADEEWLYVENGSRTMEYSRHDDTWNSRWVTRHAGIALYGPEPSDLVPEVGGSDMRREAAQMAGAREEWVRDQPEVLLDGWAQPYVVLTLCRLLWTATFAGVASKEDAASWVGRARAPGKFHALIEASIRYRREPFDAPSNRADPALAPLAGDFVRWATQEVYTEARRRTA